MLKLNQMLRSRKFWAALVGLALVILKSFRPDFPVNEQQVTDFITVIAAYILGVALDDRVSSSR